MTDVVADLSAEVDDVVATEGAVAAKLTDLTAQIAALAAQISDSATSLKVVELTDKLKAANDGVKALLGITPPAPAPVPTTAPVDPAAPVAPAA